MFLEDTNNLGMSVHENTTVKEVLNLPLFKDFGRLLFPVNRSVSLDMTLKTLSSSSIYLWYSHIQVDQTVEIINTLYEDANKHTVFYNIYSEEEILKDPSKKDTGIFLFKGHAYAPFAICNAVVDLHM